MIKKRKKKLYEVCFIEDPGDKIKFTSGMVIIAKEGKSIWSKIEKGEKILEDGRLKFKIVNLELSEEDLEGCRLRRKKLNAARNKLISIAKKYWIIEK